MAVDITQLSDEELKKKINSAKLIIERNTGLIKKASEKKLKKLEDELAKRGASVEKDVKEDVKEVEKEVKKEVEKFEDKVEDKKPAPKKRGRKPSTSTAKATPKKRDRKPSTRKPAATTTKKEDASPTESFELKIDGKTYKFSDLKSKQACENAMNAVRARYKESKEHKKAREEGRERAATIPVTQKITDGFASIAKKAVAEVPKTKIDKKPEEIKKELDEVEKAFNNLFDKLGELMGKKIPQTQRKQIMSILTKFEDKVEKGSTKKDTATSKVRKEDGGLAGSGSENNDSDMFGSGNSWSYASLM